MRIISPFHDYYDCIQAYGQDDLVYYRSPVTIEYPNVRRHRSRIPVGYGGRACENKYLQYGNVGFCKNFHPFIRFWDGDSLIKVCYSPDEVHEVAKDLLRKRDYKIYQESDCYRIFRRHLGFLYSKGFVRRDVNDWFAKWENDPLFLATQRASYDGIFSEEHIPVFVKLGGESLTRNGCLKDVEFYRVYDPYSAFQEIATFLSNVALPEPHTLEISDENLAASKGFDEFSFRKPPRKIR